MRSPRAVAAWALALLLVFTLAPASGAEEGAAASGPDLAVGWSVEAGATGPVLVYTPDEALPLRDARPEFRDGDALLGYPAQRDGRLELALTPSAFAALGSPSAWLSGQRLDGPTPVEPIVREPLTTDPLPTRALTGKDDPGTPGPYATTIMSYELEGLAVDEFPAPLEVLAEVVAPVGAPTPMPLVLFLHGRHSTCYGLDPEPFVTGDWPCPEGLLPIPSHEGYRYVAELLASQGYLTVSISANGVNGQDGWVPDGGAAARSALIHHHLGLWADWDGAGGDPWGGLFQGAVDLDNVVLVGHSRGGEGVERAAVDASFADGYTIVGLVPIGPTSFGRQVGAGIATAVILPYCDGDVVDLQGQIYVDQSRDLTRDRALRSAVMVVGTNHNFYNTEWTPGLAQAPSDDDWLWAGPADEPTCGPEGPGRLTPEEQQAVGATYIAALVQVAVERDAAAASLLDGSKVRAASAGRARVLTHALGGRRSLVYTPRLVRPHQHLGPVGPGLPGLHGRRRLGLPVGVRPDRLRPPAPLADDDGGGVGTQPPRPGVAVVAHRRHGPPHSPQGQGPVQGLPPGPAPRRRRGLQLGRTGGAPHRPARRRSSTSPQPTGSRRCRGRQVPLAKIWAQTLRFDLTGARAGIDLSQITGIELVSRTGRGHAWLLDIHARRPGGHSLVAHRPATGEREHRRSPRGRPRHPRRVLASRRFAARSPGPPSSGCPCSPQRARRATAWSCRRALPKPASPSPSRGTTSSTRGCGSTAWSSRPCRRSPPASTWAG